MRLSTKIRKSSAVLHTSPVSATTVKVALLIFQMLLLLAGCDNQSETKIIDFNTVVSENEHSKSLEQKNRKQFIFGFDPRRSLKDDMQQYTPFIQYLEETTGYHFKLRITPGGAHISDELGKGTIHFGAIGAGSFIKANEKYDIVPLVRGLNKQGKAEYQSCIIVATNSPINKIEDIRGKRFAFGDIASTQGHLIPRIILAEHGITLNDLASHGWTGSHYKCANSVIAGEFDAGGIQDTLGLELKNDGLVRVIYTSQYYPSSGVAVNKNVPSVVTVKVKEALLAFDPKGRHKHMLFEWDKTEMPNGFVEAKVEDYTELSDWAKEFDLIKTQ